MPDFYHQPAPAKKNKDNNIFEAGLVPDPGLSTQFGLAGSLGRVIVWA